MLACVNTSVIIFRRGLPIKKKTDLKKILSPLLAEYYEKSRSTTDVAAAMSTLAEDTAIFTSGTECGMGDHAEGLSAQEF